METRWSKRAKQLDQLALNTAGMYAELDGIMGLALPPSSCSSCKPETDLRLPVSPAYLAAAALDTLGTPDVSEPNSLTTRRG